MPAGGEGELTVTVRMKVSPEPEQEEAVLDLLRRYRNALNYSVRVIIENRALSLSKAHKLLYNDLKERYGLRYLLLRLSSEQTSSRESPWAASRTSRW